MSFDLAIPYQAPAYTMQGFNALASGVQDFFQKQKQQQDELQQMQAEKAKNDTIIQHAAGLTRPDGTPYISTQELLDYQNAPLKKQISIGQGIGANIAFDTARLQQQPRISVLQPPPGSNMPPQTIQSLPPGTSNITPFQPQQVTVPPPASNPTGPAIGGVMTSKGQFQVLNSKPVPANANKTIMQPNGQFVAYGPTGEPHPLASTNTEFKALSDARAKAEQGVLDNSAQYGLDLNDISQIVQDPTGIKYQAATNQITPMDKSGNPKGNPIKIQRSWTDPKTGVSKLVDVNTGEALSSQDAGAIIQTYGPGAVRATGKVGEKDFNLPFPTLLAATNRYQSLPPKPMLRGAGSSEPMVSVLSPSGVPGFIPQSKLKAALANGYKEQ